MSQLSVTMQSPSILQTNTLESQAPVKGHKKNTELMQQTKVAKFSSEINFAALGINASRYDKASLNNLKQSPATVVALANHRLNMLKKTQDKEKKVKTKKWSNLKLTGKMTETEYKGAIQSMNNSHSDEFKQTKHELEEILEIVQKNRQVKEGEIIKDHGLDSVETNKEIEKLDKTDEVTTKKFVKDLPSLDEKPKKSFFQRLFSKSGLAILATTLVGAAAIAIGVLALPALGVLAAVGLTAALAVPSLYSSVSSFIAVCNPNTKNALENIDDLRLAASGTPTELSTAKRQLTADRHAEILKTIDETNTQVGDGGEHVKAAEPGDVLALWRSKHPSAKPSIVDVKRDKVQLIDPEIFGLKGVKKKNLEDLSSSPTAVLQFAEHTIARQQKVDEKEVAVLTRKLNGLVAVGEKTEAEKTAILDQVRERQQKDMDSLCGKLSEMVDTVERNRTIVQANDLASAEAADSKKTFEELFAVREETDKKLVEKYSKDLPDLDPDAKKSSFVKRLFSWQGAKVLVSSVLAGLAIAAAVLVPPLGLAATLGVAIAAASSTYSAVSSIVTLCNPKAKNVLQSIEDIRNGINGSPSELASLNRTRGTDLHEEILEKLKSSKGVQQSSTTQSSEMAANTAINSAAIKRAEHVQEGLTVRLEKAKTEKNDQSVAGLTALNESVKTVLNAEKTIAASANQPKTIPSGGAAQKPNVTAFDFETLGIDASKYKKNALDTLQHSPNAVQELATYQLKSLEKTHAREVTIKTAKWDTLLHTGKMSQEEYNTSIQELKVHQTEEFEKTKLKLEGMVQLAKENRVKKEGEIADKFGVASVLTDENIEKLEKLDKKMADKFTKDLPSLDDKPKKSFFKRIFSKSGLAILATALVGAAAIALGVGALPALAVFTAVGLTVAAASKIATKAAYTTVSSIVAVCAPDAKATLEHIEDLRKATSGSPTELAAAGRKKEIDRHAEILETIERTRNPAGETLLGAWEKEHPEIQKKREQSIQNVENAETQLIDVAVLGIEKAKQKDIEQLSSSPDAVQRLANLQIAKQQKLHDRELTALTRRLEGLVAIGKKTEDEKNAILNRCRENHTKEMDALCTKLSSTVDVVQRNRTILEARDIAAAEKADSKADLEELFAVHEEADKALVDKFCKDLPDLDADAEKSSFVKRLFSWKGAKMLISAALAGIAIAAVVLLPPLGIATAAGLAVAAFATSNAYSVVTSFVSICNPNANAFLQEIDDIRNGINGTPTELSKMRREAAAKRHEEILDHLNNKAGLYQEEYFTNDPVSNKTVEKSNAVNPAIDEKKIDTILVNAEKNGDEKRNTCLSILKQTLTTVVKGEKKCNQTEDENDLILSQMQFQMPI